MFGGYLWYLRGRGWGLAPSALLVLILPHSPLPVPCLLSQTNE